MKSIVHCSLRKSSLCATDHIYNDILDYTELQYTKRGVNFMSRCIKYTCLEYMQSSFIDYIFSFSCIKIYM